LQPLVILSGKFVPPVILSEKFAKANLQSKNLDEVHNLRSRTRAGIGVVGASRSTMESD